MLVFVVVGPSQSGMWLVVGVSWLPGLLMPIVLWINPARRRVIRATGRLCGNCLFPLEGLPVQGDCPECGHSYSIKHTIACWKHDLGLNGMYEYRHWPELPKEEQSRNNKPEQGKP